MIRGFKMQQNQPQQQIQEEEIDLLQYLKILLRYWWLIGPMSLIGGVGVYLICLYLPPKYRAETRFEILENKAIQLEGDITEEFRGRNFNPLNRHIVLIEGGTVNGAIQNQLFNKYPELKDFKLKPFVLSAKPVRGAETVMLDVSVDSFSEEAALEYLNLLLTEYAKIRLEESQQELQETRKTLEGESARLDAEIDQLQLSVEDFKIKNNFMFMETKTAFDRKFIAELLEKANQKQFQLDILQGHLVELQKAKGDQVDPAAFSQAVDAFLSITQSGRSWSTTQSSFETDIIEWKKKEVELRKLQAERKIKLKKYKEAHPHLREVSDAIEVVEAEQDVYTGNILSTMKGRLRTMQVEKKSYLDKAKSVESSIGDHSGLLSRYQSMQQKLDNLISMKNKIHSKVIAISTDGSKEKYFTRMIREPQLYDGAVWPNKLKFSALGFILFFGGSSALMLFIFISRSKNYNFSKIIQEYGANCLATIPHFPPSKLKKDPLFLNSVHKGSVLSESYRSLRISVENQLKDGKSLVVTSFGPGEGKTTSSLNLALCWAWTGKKVLLIDGDFRRATLRKVFKTAPKEGLIDYLKDESKNIDQFLVREVCENLTYLPAGHHEELITELLEGKRMRQLMESLEKDFDMIIIDSAPVMRVVDTLRLAEMTAGSLVVARSGKSKPEEVAQVFKKIIDHKVIGFMVNDFSAAHVKYLSYSGDDQVGGYSYGYAYESYKKKY